LSDGRKYSLDVKTVQYLLLKEEVTREEVIIRENRLYYNERTDMHIYLPGIREEMMMLMRTGSKNVKNEIEVLFLLKMIAILFPFTLSVIEEGMSCESDHDLISKESSSCSKYV